MRPIYKRKTELTKKIKLYFKQHKKYAPRHFRVYIGLSKQMIQKYKKEKPEWYNSIKQAEDVILAKLEFEAIHNPDLKKGQTLSILFTLKSYDPHRYVPELAYSNETAQNNTIKDNKTIIKFDIKKLTKKGDK